MKLKIGLAQNILYQFNIFCTGTKTNCTKVQIELQQIYSGFQVMGMIEWGQNSKPKEIPRASNKTPKKIPGPKLTPQKPHAEILCLKNLQKALNDITRKI